MNSGRLGKRSERSEQESKPKKRIRFANGLLADSLNGIFKEDTKAAPGSHMLRPDGSWSSTSPGSGDQNARENRAGQVSGDLDGPGDQQAEESSEPRVAGLKRPI